MIMKKNCVKRLVNTDKPELFEAFIEGMFQMFLESDVLEWTLTWAVFKVIKSRANKKVN